MTLTNLGRFVIFQTSSDHLFRALNSNELRSLLIWLLDAPLKKESVVDSVGKLNHCFDDRIVATEEFDAIELTIRNAFNGTDEDCFEIKLDDFLKCDNFLGMIPEEKLKQQTNQFEELPGNEDTTFFMIKSNYSLVLNGLDQIRKHPKKFICLNDDLDHSSNDEETLKVKRTIRSFYESLFPIRSQFELEGEDEWPQKKGRKGSEHHLNQEKGREIGGKIKEGEKEDEEKESSIGNGNLPFTM